MTFGDEHIGHRIPVAAGAAQTDHVPDIGHRGVTLWKQQGTENFAAVRAAQWRAVGTMRHDMGAEPAGMMAAAGEVPCTGQAEPARDGAQFGRPDRAPGDDAVGWPENFLRNFGIEKGGSHRAAVRLLDTPAGAGVKTCELLDHLHVGHRVELGSAKRPRLQQAEEPVVDQRSHNRLR